MPIFSVGEAADAWLATLDQRLFDGEVDERTVSEHTSAFVSLHLDLDEIWRSPFTDLYVLVDEWDQGWGAATRSSRRHERPLSSLPQVAGFCMAKRLLDLGHQVHAPTGLPQTEVCGALACRAVTSWVGSAVSAALRRVRP